MHTVQINLNSIDKVKAFVHSVNTFNTEFDLVSGRFVDDAEIMESLKPFLVQ